MWLLHGVHVLTITILQGTMCSSDSVVDRPANYYQIDDMLFLSSNRAGQANSVYRWPKGRIPFSFAPGYTRYQRNEVRLAMDYIEEFTCIRFQSRAKNDENYLYFRNLEGKCSSFVGNIRRGPQQVALDPKSRKCSRPNFPGHVLHELVHAIGFFHEHARNDRDRYIKILYENLPEDSKTSKNYNKNKDNDLQADDFGVPYNYGSIMHYSNKAGSINGEETIVRKAVKGKPLPLNGIMGQRDKLSYGDIKMIQSMYKNECPGTVDLNDVPDTEDIPDLEDWMDDRMLAMESMPDMPIEEVDEVSEGIVDEVDNNAASSENDSFQSAAKPTMLTTTTMTAHSTTGRPLPTTRRTRRTTKRRPPRSTTPVTTRTPNLYNLIQYLIKEAMNKSG